MMPQKLAVIWVYELTLDKLKLTPGHVATFCTECIAPSIVAGSQCGPPVVCLHVVGRCSLITHIYATIPAMIMLKFFGNI